MKWLAPSGLSTKDFIAPSSFEFSTGRAFRMGRRFGAVSFVQIMAPELNDRMLADFLDMESSLVVNLHIQSVDQTSAIKTVKRKITELDRSKIEEQKKAVRAGYDMDILPSDLTTYGNEAKKLLQDLQSRNERMFLVTFLIVNTADSQAGSVNTSCEICSVNLSECVGKEPEPEPVPEPETPEPEGPEKKNVAGPVVVLLVMVLAGGGAACYQKFFKKKPDVSGSADLDDYDYGGEDGQDAESWEDGDPEDGGE